MNFWEKKICIYVKKSSTCLFRDVGSKIHIEQNPKVFQALKGLDTYWEGLEGVMSKMSFWVEFST